MLTSTVFDAGQQANVDTSKMPRSNITAILVIFMIQALILAAFLESYSSWHNVPQLHPQHLCQRQTSPSGSLFTCQPHFTSVGGISFRKSGTSLSHSISPGPPSAVGHSSFASW